MNLQNSTLGPIRWGHVQENSELVFLPCSKIQITNTSLSFHFTLFCYQPRQPNEPQLKVTGLVFQCKEWLVYLYGGTVFVPGSTLNPLLDDLERLAKTLLGCPYVSIEKDSPHDECTTRDIIFDIIWISATLNDGQTMNRSAIENLCSISDFCKKDLK